ncbi:MAG: nitrogen regulation protein NR(II), partial [Thiotrichaceae bacterium]
LDSLANAVLVTDTNLNLQYMNPAAEEFIGSSFSRVKGVALLSFLSSTQLDRHIKQVITDQHLHVTREAEITLHGHKVINVDYAITPLLKNDKKGNTLTGVLFELNRVDRQMRIARDTRLIDTQDTNQSMLRGIAHEIKNPLGGLRGAAQLLEMEFSDNNSNLSTETGIEEYTQVIISEADRLTKLVDNMLGSHHAPQKSLVNIHEVLEHARLVTTPKLPKEITISTDYDPSIPDIKGDRDQLVQVVLNIINNAARSLSDRGHILLKTRVVRNFTIRQQNHPLVLCAEIIDDGEGIPKALQNKVFYPMISGHADGTGLGLSIAQSLINQHNGLIELRSKPGETQFTIILPIRL